VADHATNIAEDVIFWVRGADVRHNVFQEQAETGELPTANVQRIRETGQ
jgi:phosphate uptake regulator